MQTRLIHLAAITHLGPSRIFQLTPKPGEQEPYRFIVLDQEGNRELVIGDIAFHLQLAIIARIGDTPELPREIMLSREEHWRNYFGSGVVIAAGIINASHEVISWESTGLKVITPYELQRELVNPIKTALAQF